MYRWFITGLIGTSIFAQAQSVSTLMGGRAAGMGYTGAVLSDETALINNVGAMAGAQEPSVFFACESQPALPGASRVAAGCTWPTRIMAAGLGFFRFGDDLYSEQMVSVGLSNKFGIASLGAKVNYVQYRADEFGTKTAFSVDFGGLAQITPEISVGAYVVNLNQSMISDDQRLPTKLVAGFGIRPDDRFFLATEIEKDIDYKTTWRVGAEYSILKKVFFRTGFNVDPNAGFAGLGVKVKRIKIDYAIKFSDALGVTHQASAACLLEHSKKK